jgi:hypothetical protein
MHAGRFSRAAAGLSLRFPRVDPLRLRRCFPTPTTTVPNLEWHFVLRALNSLCYTTRACLVPHFSITRATSVLST